MLHEQSDFMILENELRHSLMRGYRQVRAAQTQGVYLRGAECALELLGDPHLLVLTYPSVGLRLRIPVVFVAEWELDEGSDAVEKLQEAFRDPDRVLTGYRRRYAADKDTSGIHSALVKRLRQLVTGFPDRRVLLDWMWAPRPYEDNHDEIRSENWFAYHKAQQTPNSVFSALDVALPSQVRSVDGLVRLSFPLSSPSTGQTGVAHMVTLVLCFAFEFPDETAAQGPIETTSRIANAVRGLATVLMREIPQLYKVIDDRKQHAPVLVRPPDWLPQRDRDALHSAVDDLHRKVIALAGRVGLDNWALPAEGFNFVLAFRELDDRQGYHAKLRYRLSTYNLHALGAGEPDLAAWRKKWEEGIARCTPDLEAVFARSEDLATTPELQMGTYVNECRQVIGEIFAEDRTLDDVRLDLARSIEAEQYHMRLTPGYWVMDLCHPEVIEEWLKDPRAKNFHKYPARLLVWEASALPKEIYYSPVVDGAVPIGICGINNDLIEKNACPAYELQELIDESAPRFRRILTNNELETLGNEVRSVREMLGDEVGDGAGLWLVMLRRFRRLAYYYLPSPYDYHTKLVRNSELQVLFSSKKWGRQASGWWERQGLDRNDVGALYQASDMAPATPGQTTDFIRKYLEDTRGCRDELGEFRGMPDVYLHRVSVREAPDLSLVVLVPFARHNELAQELIHRFAATCGRALQEYREEVGARKKLPQKEDDRVNGPFDVFLSYSSPDREQVTQIAEGLYRQGIIPWFDRWATLPGEAWLPKLEEQINTISCAIIFIGSGPGEWHRAEIESLLISLRERKGTVIPVLISKDAGVHQLPPFLSRLQALNYHEEPDPLSVLVRAIEHARTPRAGQPDTPPATPVRASRARRKPARRIS